MTEAVKVSAREAPRVFVSYRRDDVPDATDRLAAALVEKFGREHVFLDVDSIEIGVPFARVIDGWVGRCDVVLAVMGRGWIRASDDQGKLRLGDPTDYVRLELESGLRREIPVVPVLIHGAAMPRRDELPEPLKPLLDRNATELSRRYWDLDVDGLIAGLRRIADEAVAANASDGQSEDQADARRVDMRPSPSGNGAREPGHRTAEARNPTSASASDRGALGEERAPQLGLRWRGPHGARWVAIGVALLVAVAAAVVLLTSGNKAPSHGTSTATAALRQDVTTLNGIAQLFISGKRTSQLEHNFTAAAENRRQVLERLSAFDPPPELRGAAATLSRMTAESLTFNLLMADGKAAAARAPDQAHNALRPRFVAQFKPFAQRFLNITYSADEF